MKTNILTEGDHFGEISLIYGCPRTATVISRNFSTLGSLSYDRYRDVTNEFFELEYYMKNYIFTQYHDDQKKFLINIISEFDFLQGILTQETAHELIYSL